MIPSGLPFVSHMCAHCSRWTHFSRVLLWWYVGSSSMVSSVVNFPDYRWYVWKWNRGENFVHMNMPWITIYQCFSCACVCLHYKSENFRGEGGTTLQSSYLLDMYFVLYVHRDKQMQLGRSSWSGRNWGAADEADAIGEKLGLAMWDYCSPETLPHKGVRASE